jgi:hypothetical protein
VVLKDEADLGIAKVGQLGGAQREDIATAEADAA